MPTLGNKYGNYKLFGGYSDRFFDKKLGVSLALTTEQKQMPSNRLLPGTQLPIMNILPTDTLLLTRTQNLTLVDQQQTRHRTNGSLILDYHNDWWQVKFFNLLSIKNDDVLTRTNQRVFTLQDMAASYTQNVNEAFWKTMTRTHSLQNTFRFGASKIDVDLSTTYSEVSMENQSFPFVENSRLTMNQDSLIYGNPKVAFDINRRAWHAEYSYFLFAGVRQEFTGTGR